MGRPGPGRAEDDALAVTPPEGGGVRLPAGTRLLHIGPHKTGTTAVQSAFHLARRAALAQGVRYAGPSRHPVGAAQAIVASTTPERVERPIRPWRRLAREVTIAREPITVISSEWFADADPEAIRAIVRDLGGTPVHVVVTVRPLARILPSQWQQYVQAGFDLAYEPWLARVFGDPVGSVTPSFWQRHRHDERAARWAEVVGPGRVTVVVLDDRDHGVAMRAFEDLTGLDRGTLVPEDARINRSLTAPEIELIRQVNRRLAPERLPGWLHLNLVLYGAAAALRLRVPSSGEPRVETPAWAEERAAEMGRAAAEAIAASGVWVIGDVARLGEASPDRKAGRAGTVTPQVPWAAATAWPDLVAAAVMGTLTATGLTRSWRGRPEHRTAISLVPASRLLAISGRRALAAARSAVPGRPAAGFGGSAAPGDRNGPPARPLTAEEQAVQDACARAFAAAGVGTNLRATLASAIAGELLAEPQPAAEVATPDRWAEIGAAAVVGVARASGLLGADGRRLAAGRRTAPPRARGETLEVAGVSTAGLATIAAARLVGAARARVRGAVERRQGTSGSGRTDVR